MSFLKILIERLHESLYRNEEALNYLHSRKVSDEEIKLFKIGYSRVVGTADDGSEDYQCFLKETHRGRDFESKITFPLYDMIGNPIGLLGRAINTKEFKFYLTLEGKYSGAFFGLSQSLPLIYDTGLAFTVEGPFDLLAFRKVYPNSVATLTAELTEAQYNILSMYAKNIITVFDSDIPGRKAAERALQWPNVKSVCLGWKDPDAGLKYLNFDKFKKHVQNKISPVALFL
jgi:DNA primase